MPVRKTIEQVQEDVFRISNGETILLSSTYINSKAPLLFLCSCGNQFERSLDKVINRKSYKCITCSRNHQSEISRKKLESVISIIESMGCKYISGNYINETSLLTIQCACGEMFVRDYNHFQRGQNKCDKCWHKDLAIQKTKYTKDDARKIFSSRGYIMIGDYVNAGTPVSCVCKNGHLCNLILSQFFQNRSGCEQCMRKTLRGVNAPAYKNGNCTMQDALRNGLSEWKLKVAEYYNWTCPLTGSSFEECDVHHIKSLKSIYKEIASLYGIKLPMKSKIKDYPSYEIFDKIRCEVINAHTVNMGIFISTGVHRNFHKLYSQRNATPEQFEDFLKTMYGTCLQELQNRIFSN